MYRYKIIIAYDGTRYFGWQAQPGKPTVVKALQDTYAKVFNAKITVVGASRTDAGVHALGQVATFVTEQFIDPQKMIHAWNSRLPVGIAIQQLELAHIRYSPFIGVESKTYWYHFFLDRPLPFVRPYGWYKGRAVSLKKLEEALPIFVGTHDFRSFTSGDDRGTDTIRTIESITLEYVPEINGYRIVVKGPKFLRYMVRRLVGALLDVAAKDTPVEHLRSALEEKNPRQTLPTAPAHGLVLKEIKYASEIEIDRLQG